MTDPETPLQQAERHVREGAARVARQEAVLAGMVRDKRRQQAILLGSGVLANLRQSLELMRGDLERKRANA